MGVAKQLFGVPRETKCKERPAAGGKHTQSAKQKEVQERESERSLGLLGLPPLTECKVEGEEADSDDSTDTVRYSPPKPAINRSTSVQLPKLAQARKGTRSLRRATSLPLNQQGLKVDRRGTLSLAKFGGGIVKKRGKKIKVGKVLGGRCKDRDSCDC